MDISNNQYDITLRDTVRIIFKYKWGDSEHFSDHGLIDLCRYGVEDADI